MDINSISSAHPTTLLCGHRASKSESVNNAAPSSGVQTADFANMTHKEMADWMNGEISAGRMSLEDSGPFLAMNFSDPTKGGGNPDEKLDFYAIAQRYMHSAQTRGDSAEAAKFERALNLMHRAQGGVTRADLLA